MVCVLGGTIVPQCWAVADLYARQACKILTETTPSYPELALQRPEAKLTTDWSTQIVWMQYRFGVNTQHDGLVGGNERCHCRQSMIAILNMYVTLCWAMKQEMVLVFN